MDDGKELRTQNGQISLFLDQALEPDEQKQFALQVLTDPDLYAAVERERQFRALIKENLNRPALEPEFVEYIKNKLH